MENWFRIFLLLAVDFHRLFAQQVAVAANFSPVFNQILEAYEKKAGKSEFAATVGSTGLLFQQITQGAPYSIMIAADDVYPAKLVEQGLAEPSQLIIYGVGQLVLWSADADFFKGTDGAKKLQAWGKGKLAIANPKLAPYGTAAMEVLEKIGLKAKLESSVVYGENVSQAFQFAATKSADAAFMAMSQVIANDNKGAFWEVPQDMYKPIRQQMVLLKKAKGDKKAEDFYQFLQSPEAKAIISKFGYKADSK